MSATGVPRVRAVAGCRPFTRGDDDEMSMFITCFTFMVYFGMGSMLIQGNNQF